MMRALTLFLLAVVSWGTVFGQTIQATFDGKSLAVAAVQTDDDTEMCYWFKRCMENELFTFYRVGYRSIDRNTPSVDGILLSDGITWLNTTTSDNIGPLKLADGIWVGGNHTKSGRPTAATRLVEVYVDGNLLADDGIACYGDVVTVKVVNDIYDPLGEVDPETNSFVDPLTIETVFYTVSYNSIDVSLRHDFVGGEGNVINTYYGMQSMFMGEDQVMTPHGAFPDFVPSSEAVAFNAVDYPDFDCFIEKQSSTGWCQASLLLPDGIGDHRYVTTKQIFVRATGKCYHVLIRNLPITQGLSYQWHGIYSWFVPAVDNDDVLVYTFSCGGQEQLVVDVKQSCATAFELPPYVIGKKLVTIQQDANTKANVKGDKMLVSTDAPSTYRAGIIDEPTSVEIVPSDANVRATRNGIEIYADVTALVQIYDFTGRIVKQSQVNGRVLMCLPQGAYLVVVDGRPTKVVVR